MELAQVALRRKVRPFPGRAELSRAARALVAAWAQRLWPSLGSRRLEGQMRLPTKGLCPQA